MEENPTPAALSQSQPQRRPATSRQSRRLGRNPLGAVDGRPMASFAAPVSEPFDLLATPERMGGRRHMAQNLAQVSVRTGPRRAAQLGRILHGRHVRPGKKRGPEVGPTKRGKGTKLMVVADGQGLPLGEHVSSASPAEVTLAERTIQQVGSRKKRLRRLVADRAYDSDSLRERLARAGIELVCPHRRGRKKLPTQDGRKLRRYKRRWKIERLFAWLGNYRRLVNRWEWYPEMFRAFVHVAFIMITLKRF